VAAVPLEAMGAPRSVALALAVVCSACGLNAAGLAAPDATTAGPDVGATVDAGRDATARDAGADVTRAADGGTTGDATADHAVPDGSAHDGQPSDGAHDEGGHDAETDAHHVSDAPHDAGPPDAPGSDASGPPSFCLVNYACGSSTCPCTQTCSHGQCGACVPGWASCGGLLNLTCGTQLSSTLSCGNCSTSCSCSSFPFIPSCNATDGGYACGC